MHTRLTSARKKFTPLSKPLILLYLWHRLTIIIDCCPEVTPNDLILDCCNNVTKGTLIFISN